MEQLVTLTNLIPADKLIHMTATYSNAVMMLILTNVSDFAKKLDLPIPQPVTVAQIQKASVNPIKDAVGGVVTLTNGDRFFYNQGHIGVFYGHDHDPFSDNMDPGERHQLWVEKFRGRMNMTTNEVIEFARDSLRKLGYDPKAIGADGPPSTFSGPWFPEDNPGAVIPICDLEWRDRKTRNYVTFTINADKKRIIRLSLSGPYFRRPEPKLGIEPELERDYRKRTEPTMFIRTNAPPRVP